MLKRIDRDNEPYRTVLTIPKEKVNELFILINDMDTQKLKEFTISRNIQLNVEEISYSIELFNYFKNNDY